MGHHNMSALYYYLNFRPPQRIFKTLNKLFSLVPIKRHIPSYPLFQYAGHALAGNIETLQPTNILLMSRLIFMMDKDKLFLSYPQNRACRFISRNLLRNGSGIYSVVGWKLLSKQTPVYLLSRGLVYLISRWRSTY